jgi:enoyl-[acyl-carrier-protein] reductase (NADH)
MVDQGVTVNCIASGVSEDFLLSHAATGQSIQVAMQSVSALVPTAQLMDSEKIANLVAFIASPLSNGITGQTLVASQGLTVST